jgi:tyrosine-protein kinase Etk/Wzc
MPDAIETEALRQARAKIILGAGGEFPHVLTVLSYDSGDGKTLTSSNLAMETANAGMRTLVIDGDMRRGDLHEIFRMPNVFGLSDILASKEPVPNLVWGALIDSGYNNLTVLTYGRATNDPAALLASRRFSELLDLLRPEFEAIIIDAAPTIAASDATFMGENSDGVVIVVNTRRTRLSALRQGVSAQDPRGVFSPCTLTKPISRPARKNWLAWCCRLSIRRCPWRSAETGPSAISDDPCRSRRGFRPSK